MLHASVVHFPIALLFLCGGLYFFLLLRPGAFPGKWVLAFHLIGVAALGAAILSGNSAEQETALTPAMHEVVEKHELAGYISVWAFGLMALWRYMRGSRLFTRRWEGSIFVGLFTLALLVLAFTAHEGGELVYDFGAGVKPMQETLQNAR
jgi:uncharacterized membrane protein